MVESQLTYLSAKILKGAKYTIGRNPAGRMRLKLLAGPFGLLTRRFDVSDADLQQLRQLLTARDRKAIPDIKTA